jgi:hypothetical protein
MNACLVCVQCLRAMIGSRICRYAGSDASLIIRTENLPAFRLKRYTAPSQDARTAHSKGRCIQSLHLRSWSYAFIVLRHRGGSHRQRGMRLCGLAVECVFTTHVRSQNDSALSTWRAHRILSRPKESQQEDFKFIEYAHCKDRRFAIAMYCAQNLASTARSSIDSKLPTLDLCQKKLLVRMVS